MKSFSERNPLILGIVGAVVIAGIVMAALNWQKVPLLNPGRNYSAHFADAGGLFTGAGVEVSGLPVGKVSSIELDGQQVLVKFHINGDVHLGDRTVAAIRTKGGSTDVVVGHFRPGRAGQSPPRVSSAMAIRACGLWNP